jgi:HD-GYP domain-containing protein (c-di-GMP phosphodiesterase class II)
MSKLEDILTPDADFEDGQIGQEPPQTLDEALTRFTSLLMASLRNALIYAPNHSQFQHALDLAEKAVQQVCRFLPEIAFVCMEREILHNGRPLNSLGLQFVKLGSFLDSIGVGILTIKKGLGAEELKSFILHMVGKDKEGLPTGKRIVRATPHIALGRVKGGQTSKKLRLSHQAIVGLLAQGAVNQDDLSSLKASGGQVRGERLLELDAGLLNRARQAVKAASGVKTDDRVSTRETLMNFVYYFVRYSDLFSILHHLKNHDELSFKHSVNVALLCAGQARSLNLPVDAARDIVLSGLFHDIGKVAVDYALLNKPLPLSDGEKLKIAIHCEEGARILAQYPQIPAAAVVAALEHHIHFGGKRGYPRRHRIGKPHAVSQMVALADVYDSLRTTKPYRPAFPMDRALEIIEKRCARQFDPFLVANFARSLQFAQE